MYAKDGSIVPKGPKGAALSERAARVLRESSRISRLQRVGNEACLCGLSHLLQYKSCTVPKLYSTKVDFHELLAKDYLLVTFEKRSKSYILFYACLCYTIAILSFHRICPNPFPVFLTGGNFDSLYRIYQRISALL